MLEPNGQINYLFVFASSSPADITSFQGFSRGLMGFTEVLPLITRLPASIEELKFPSQMRLLRRRAGLGSWTWSPIELRTLTERVSLLIAEHPLFVVFSEDIVVAKTVSDWITKQTIKPLHVSSVQVDGAIHPHELSIEHLQRHCNEVLDTVKGIGNVSEGDATEKWECNFSPRPSSLRFHSHGVTRINEIVLRSIGEAFPALESGRLINSRHEDYVTGISESVAAVLTAQLSCEGQSVSLDNPVQPDLYLFAPSVYSQIFSKLLARKLPPQILTAIKAMQRQKGYRLELDSREFGKISGTEEFKEFLAIVAERSRELAFQTSALGIRAASSVCATIRLPADINRAGGRVGLFCKHVRTYDNKLPDKKTARVFQAAQQALLEGIPKEHLDFMANSKSGIKIIADAPLEWLPLNGLPLGIRKDVSRICATPGNLLIEQLSSSQPVYLDPNQMKNLFVVSTFQSDDNLVKYLPNALKFLASAESLGLSVVPAKTVDEFKKAVNSCDGGALIIDGHGTHGEDPNVGKLLIGGDLVDVWELAGELNLPPIVVLSACDTQPSDRSHASIANGFLKCGAKSVLSTVLPIRANHASLFLVRLFLRATRYGGMMAERGSPVPWTNIVGGAIRMHLAFDVVTTLMERGLLSWTQAEEIQFAANVDINYPRVDWFERLAAKCQEHCKFDSGKWQETFDGILVGSDVIRYVNLGNPELIILSA